MQQVNFDYQSGTGLFSNRVCFKFRAEENVLSFDDLDRVAQQKHILDENLNLRPFNSRKGTQPYDIWHLGLASEYPQARAHYIDPLTENTPHLQCAEDIYKKQRY